MGLDDTLYGAVRSQQLFLTPLTTLNRAYHVVLQEERLRCLVNVTEDVPDITAYSVKTANRPFSKPDWKEIREKEKSEKRKLHCTHCDKRGHDLKTCFFYHNTYPNWWGNRPRANVIEKSNGVAGSSSNSNTTTTGAAVRVSDELVRANVITSGDASCTDHKLKSHKSLKGMSFQWIIDTGASNHVTGDITFMTETTTILARPVGLPDGQQVTATLMGTVPLNDRVTLRSVLYVPCLTCNLISVSQLTLNNDCIVEFTNTKCFIQDRTTKTTIGVGELRDRLYFFNDVKACSSIFQVYRKNNFELWHRRLGHPADKIVKLVPYVNVSSLHTHTICDVCHQAKQHR
ncbi:hypothetical protein RND81_14G105800 [Saponaria officinalis]|uniref:GAG-pre-integrase domain-containing protein n=1 Tax=Saponaria officinalis TaxID=3572 RepID=A0AAW1GKW7_SAPOF